MYFLMSLMNQTDYSPVEKAVKIYCTETDSFEITEIRIDGITVDGSVREMFNQFFITAFNTGDMLSTYELTLEYGTEAKTYIIEARDACLDWSVKALLEGTHAFGDWIQEKFREEEKWA